MRKNRKQYALNMAMAVIAGQVGCLTLAVVILAVILGLWIDNQFQTRPTFTLISVIASVPVSVIMMLLVVRAAVNRIQMQPEEKKSAQQQEEPDFGRDENP